MRFCGQSTSKTVHYTTSHMKKVDQSVSETDAKAYVQSIITEHSLSPPNIWVMVPERRHIF